MQMTTAGWHIMANVLSMCSDGGLGTMQLLADNLTTATLQLLVFFALERGTCIDDVCNRRQTIPMYSDRPWKPTVYGQPIIVHGYSRPRAARFGREIL